MCGFIHVHCPTNDSEGKPVKTGSCGWVQALGMLARARPIGHGAFAFPVPGAGGWCQGGPAIQHRPQAAGPARGLRCRVADGRAWGSTTARPDADRDISDTCAAGAGVVARHVHSGNRCGTGGCAAVPHPARTPRRSELLWALPAQAAVACCAWLAVAELANRIRGNADMGQDHVVFIRAWYIRLTNNNITLTTTPQSCRAYQQ